MVSACGLNPQPDLPSGRSDDGSVPTPAAGRSNGAGGGSPILTPSTGGTGTGTPGVPAGFGGADFEGAAGDSSVAEGGDGAGGGSGEAGAAGAAGAN